MENNNFFSTIVECNLYSTEFRLKNLINYTLGGYDLNGKRVLDIGGGTGLLTFWCAINGALSICLEPEMEGSSVGMTNGFNMLKRHLSHLFKNSNDAQLVETTFQDFNTDSKFDLIIIDNTINHLNEQATINLLNDINSRKIYISYFDKMNKLLNEGGTIVITDCSRSNFFNDIGIINPLMKTIEWHKHQSPYSWLSVASEAGFENVNIQWSSPNILGKLGRLILGNRLISYFLFSHFRLELRKIK